MKIRVERITSERYPVSKQAEDTACFFIEPNGHIWFAAPGGIPSPFGSALGASKILETRVTRYNHTDVSAATEVINKFLDALEGLQAFKRQALTEPPPPPAPGTCSSCGYTDNTHSLQCALAG